MDRFSLLFCLATYLLASTEAALDAEGIKGGEDAPDGKYKYQISIQERTVKPRNVCGGAIIDDQYVLTAAHCFSNTNGNFTEKELLRGRYIVAGVSDLSDTNGYVIRDIENVYIPRVYNASQAGPIGDIAVLKLSKPLGLGCNEKLSKLKLPEKGKTYEGKTATITGYGWNWAEITSDKVEKGGVTTTKMQVASAQVLSIETCKKMWRDILAPEKKICAKTEQPNLDYAGVCAGDSGGPLAYDDTIIGILSTSPTACDERKYSAVYTRVSEYLDFINTAMKGKVSDGIKNYNYTKSDTSNTVMKAFKKIITNSISAVKNLYGL